MSFYKNLKELWISLAEVRGRTPSDTGRADEPATLDRPGFLTRLGEPETATVPREVLRINEQLRWLQTTIRRTTSALETEFRFETPQGLLAVVVDCFPDPCFLIRLVHSHRLAIRDRTSAERGWTEGTRFEVRINDDDEMELARIEVNEVRWEFMTRPNECSEAAVFEDNCNG